LFELLSFKLPYYSAELRVKSKTVADKSWNKNENRRYFKCVVAKLALGEGKLYKQTLQTR
jgi:hypothetical protein